MGVNETEVDGVRVLWEEAPGPLTGCLLFGTGFNNEILSTFGYTHLLEHLTLRSLSDRHYFMNGFVDVVRTGFVARGTPEELVDFFTSVTAFLAEPRTEHLAKETQILRTEAASRPPTPDGESLLRRFGPKGPGLTGFMELGLNNVTPEDIVHLSTTRFTRSNAVLWLTGPPPPGLRFQMPDAVVPPPRPLVPLSMILPAWDATVLPWTTASFMVARSTENVLIAALVERRLRERLRIEEGVSYNVFVTYVPLSGQDAQLTIGADALPENKQETAKEILGWVKDRQKWVFSPEEIEGTRRQLLNMWTDPLAVQGHLDGYATSYLLGIDRPDVVRVLEELEDVDPERLTELSEGFRPSAIFLAPPGSPIAGLSPIPVNSRKSVGGTELSRSMSAWFLYRARGVKAFTSENGISLHVGGKLITVLYGECVAMLTWPDGCIQLVGADGFSITFDQRDWVGGRKLVKSLESQLSPFAVPMTGRPPDIRTGLLHEGLWGLVGASFLGLLAFGAFMDGAYGLGIGVALIATFYAIRAALALHGHWRLRHPKPAT